MSGQRVIIDEGVNDRDCMSCGLKVREGEDAVVFQFGKVKFDPESKRLYIDVDETWYGHNACMIER